MKKSLISHIPNLFTLLNAAFGLLAIIMAFESIEKSIILLIFAMISDFLDGWVARKYKVTSEIGKELDSFADSISFVVAPAILTYLFFMEIKWLAISISIFIIGCGILRLATFNLKGTTKYFVGLPTPLFTVLVLGLLFSKAGIPEWAYALLLFFGSFLMISKIHYPSFKDKSELHIKYLAGLAIGLVLISSSIFQGYTFIFVEYIIILVTLIIPLLLNKKFRNIEFNFFIAGFLVLVLVFHSNTTTLSLIPLFYTPFALPLIEKSRS